MGKFREGNLVLKSNQVIKIGTAQVNYDGSDLVINKPIHCEGLQIASGPAIVEISADPDSSSSVIILTSDAVQNRSVFKKDANGNIFGGDGSEVGTGTNNFLAGANTGEALTVGFNNICIGANSGKAITTGQQNVIIGNNAFDNVTGSYMVVIGDDAGGNGVFGHSASVFIGHAAAGGSMNVYGGQVAIGNNALYNIYGEGNIGIGSQSGRNAGAGLYNVYIGTQTAYGVTGDSGTDRDYNVIIGAKAARYIADLSMHNVLIGYRSGYNIGSGSGNVFIGFESGFDTTGDNQLIIANNMNESLIKGSFDQRWIEINGALKLDNGVFVNQFTTDTYSNSVSEVMTSSAVQSILGSNLTSIPQTSQLVSFSGFDQLNKIEALDLEEKLASISVIDTGGGIEHKPSVAVFDNGNLLVLGCVSSTQVDYTVIDTTGNAILSQTTLNSNSVRGSGATVLNNGYQAGVIVYEGSTNRNLVYYKIDNSGNIVEGPVTLLTNTSGDIAYALIKTLPNGNLLITFKDGDVDPSNPPISFIIIDTDGNIIKSRTTATPSGQLYLGNDRNYNATVCKNGNFIIIWHDYVANPDVYRGVMYDQAGNQLISTTELVSSVLTTEADPHIQVIAFNNGNFAVVYPISSLVIYFSIFDQTFNQITPGSLLFSTGAGITNIGKARLPNDKILFCAYASGPEYFIRIIDEDGDTVQYWTSSLSGALPFSTKGIADGLTKDGSIYFLSSETTGIRVGRWGGTGTKINGYLQLASGSIVNEISDSISSSDSDQLMTANAIQGAIAAASPTLSLDSLDDVLISSPSQNELLGYDGTTWVNLGNATAFLLIDDNNMISGPGAGDSLTATSADDNILIGYNAGNAIATGDSNVVIGNDALLYGVGSQAVAIGHEAGRGAAGGHSQTGSVYVGYRAGYSVQGSIYDVFIGQEAGYTTTTGDQNIAIGYRTLYYNVTGANNISIGYSAGYGSVGGSHSNNISIGYEAGRYLNTGANNNIAIGTSALLRNQTGIQNVAIGRECLQGSIGGNPSHNTCVGYRAGFGLITGGNYNSFYGYSAGLAVTTGSSNVGIGQEAGAYNKAGNFNICIGYQAGVGSVSPDQYNYDYNILIGYQVATELRDDAEYNVAMGYQAGYELREGIQNTFIGKNAGDIVESGSYNVAVGAEADFTDATATNRIAIGYQASADSDNQAIIGNSSIAQIGGYASWSDFSDRRLKTNIEDNNVGLDFIQKLRPRKFVKKDQPGKLHDGLIAQEVKQAMDELGIDFSGWSGEGNYEMLSYSTFVIPLINAVNQLKAEIEELKKNK